MRKLKQRPQGLVFISYARADRARVEPLVKFLNGRFDVWWDVNIPPGPNWRQTVMDHLDFARCVVVLWTKASVKRDIIWSEIERVKNKGIVIPVKLDSNAQIPLGFDEMQHVDLTSWKGRVSKAVEPLVEGISNLLTRPPRERGPGPDLSDSYRIVDDSLNATQELRGLSGNVGTIAGILIKRRGPVEDVVGTLEEVHRTYESVGTAIKRYLAPITKAGKISRKAYFDMERGSLVTFIRNNRGHCTRIFEYYVRVGGLREWLKPQLNAKDLKSVDDSFQRLGSADGDLFATLEQIGEALTEEASAIVGLLLSGQEKMARQRLVEGRDKLLPLEGELAAAMNELQQIESSLGYVSEGRRRARPS